VNQAELRAIGSPPVIGSGRVPWRRLAANRSLIALCVMYFGAIYGWYFYLTWLPTYLLEARGFRLASVGWLAALPLVGIAAGVFAGGFASDVLSRRWGRKAGRRVPGLIGFPLAAAGIVGALFARDPLAAALLLAAAAGLSALGVSPAWAACLDIGGAHAGVVTGAMNTLGNLGGALSPVVVGWCLMRWRSYDAPLVTVALSYLIAAAAWCWIDAEDRLEPTSGLSPEI
jgi:MFS family permease